MCHVIAGTVTPSMRSKAIVVSAESIAETKNSKPIIETLPEEWHNQTSAERESTRLSGRQIIVLLRCHFSKKELTLLQMALIFIPHPTIYLLAVSYKSQMRILSNNCLKNIDDISDI